MRLLNQRRDLSKGDLAKLADVRPGTISALLNDDTPPQVSTLLKLLKGLEDYDRGYRIKHGARALVHPPLTGDEITMPELWEFFVTGDQAELLHRKDRQQQALVDSADLGAQVFQNAMQRFAQLAQEETRTLITARKKR